MKTISVSVSEDDYEAFRRKAEQDRRPIAQLIREAMALYRAKHIRAQARLMDLPVLPGHRPVEPPPHRDEVYDEIFAKRGA